MLSQGQADRIESAVRAAETGTSSEIIVCILSSSGDDRGIAAIVGAIVFAAVQGGAPMLWWGLDPLILTMGAIVAGILAFGLCDHFDIGLRWLPARLLTKDSRRAARAAFVDSGVDNSPERNAVMLFVSRAERYVEILPDRAAAAVIAPDQWAAIVEGFRQRMRQTDMGEAVADAVTRIGVLCTAHFPASGANPDRVPNWPIQA